MGSTLTVLQTALSMYGHISSIVLLNHSRRSRSDRCTQLGR